MTSGSADELHELLERLPDIAWTMRTGDTPAFTYVSPAAERVLGEPPQVFLDDVEAFFRRVHRRDLDKVLPSPPPRGEQTAGRYRVRYFKPSGEMVWLEVHWSWVFGDDDRPKALHGITRDITTYAMLEDRVRRSERGMRNAQAMSNVGSFEWDPVRKWTLWSPEHYRLFGYEPPDGDEDANDKFQASVLPEDFVKVARVWTRALERRERFQLEYRIRRTDGVVRWIETRGGPSYDETGKLTGIDGTVRDITAERVAEDALRRFVADAAHELRTPVAALVGGIELLLHRRESLSPSQLEVLLEVLERQSSRMRDIYTSLLDLIAVEHDLGHVALTPVDVELLVEAVVGRASVGADRVRTDLQPAVVLSDTPRLERIVTELLQNAIEHGGPNIVVSTRATGADVEIVIADDGPGVRDEEAPYLFLPFSRGAQLARQGAGAGLALVERLVAVLGGSVRYEPADPGSRFVVRLAAAPSAAAAAS